MTNCLIKVLLAFENEDDFTLLGGLLSDGAEQKYELDRVSTYASALETIATHEHDFYIFGERIGYHSGLDLLKQAEAAGNRAPVILLAESSDEQTEIEAIDAGAEEFIAKKKLTARGLNRAIHRGLRRAKAQAELECLAEFPRKSSNPVVEFSADGKITYCNAAGQRLADSLQKASLTQVLPSDVDQIVLRCLERSGVKANFQTAINERTFSWSFFPVESRQVVHCYGTEITDRLSHEEQLRQSLKMEAVGQLAAGVAHDFNNILTVITGHADLLLHKVNRDPNSEHPLKQICLASERAGSLIRQLLMFSRKQVMRHRFLDLNEVVQNLMHVLQRFLGEHVELEVRLAPSVPTVFGDAGMVEQALINLAGNSRDAMPKGGRIVISSSVEKFDKGSVRGNPSARPGEFVCLRVTDTGSGMDEPTLKRIFEPFFTTKAVGKGTGLGLATVYGIVEQHHGWVDAESRVGKGSIFSIFLPVTEDKSAVKTAAPSQLAANSGKETILVVEDEPSLRLLVVEILQIYGYRVFQAPSGLVALDVWKEHKGEIDLLLTDMVMPDGVSGRELADRLLKENPELKIIYTSGYSPGMAGTDTARLSGFNFLPKPYPPSRLAELVRYCLNKKHERSNSVLAQK
ncbi:MAG: response regulator [Verrucomicrobiota bacterium]